MTKSAISEDPIGTRAVAAATLGAVATALACIVMGSFVPLLASASAASLIALTHRIASKERHVEARVSAGLQSALAAGRIGARPRPAVHRLAASRRSAVIRSRRLRRRGIHVRRMPLDMLRRPIRPVLSAAVQSVIVRPAA